MKIGTIFEIVEKRLLSVIWQGELEDSFNYIFALWSDVEYLEDFFEMHKGDLASQFWQMSVENAVFKVLDEAKEFEQDIISYAEKGDLHGIIFESLRGKNEQEFKRVHSKAYSTSADEKPSMLRMYAVRLGDCYIVTGGAIKLTKAMQERAHTALELEKLKIVSQYLKEKGIDDDTDYGYIEIENK